MIGASRESLATLRDSLPARVEGQSSSGLAGDLLAVASLLHRERGLRASLADPGTQVDSRVGTIANLLDGKVSDLAVSIVKDVVAARWSSSRDLVEAVSTLGADAAFINAESDGRLDTVENELFRFGRAIADNGSLQLVLGDNSISGEQRAGIVTSLLDGRAEPETILLITDAASSPRGRRVDDALEALSEQAATRRKRLLAEVTTAAPLSDDQATRLAAALKRIYGQDVQLEVLIDPDVVGGVSVRIDDEVIDGTIAHRLEQARRLLTGGAH